MWGGEGKSTEYGRGVWFKGGGRGVVATHLLLLVLLHVRTLLPARVWPGLHEISVREERAARGCESEGRSEGEGKGCV